MVFITLPMILGLRVLFTLAFRLHRILLFGVTRAEVLRTILSSASASLILLASVGVARRLGSYPLANVPLGAIVLDWGLLIGGLEGIWLLRRRRRSVGVPGTPRRVVIVGAGESGLALALQMQRWPEHRLLPVAFVDDDLRKRNNLLAGIPVSAPCDQVADIVHGYEADLVIIAMPSANPEQMKRIIGYCQSTGVPHRLLPSVTEMLDGRVSLGRLREIEVSDLLARPMAVLDYTAIRTLVSGQRIAITGGAGSVGLELARLVASLNPSALLLIDHAENPMFFAESTLRREFSQLNLQVAIADVTDAPMITRILVRFAPRAVFHAAAHKHVPLMESAPGEAIRNNVGGTLVAAEAASQAEAECFVLVSTDKAVHPTSVMGATKRLCELLLRDLAQHTRMRCVAVRFGNVLGSSGSVVPIFQRQIDAGGPVTVTDERMERYFMAIPEAAGLILEAAAVGQSGQTFILDMGEPVRIISLAETMIRMHNLVPYDDVEIIFTGVRPGEKLTEELNYQGETFEPTGHDKLLVVREQEPVPILEGVSRLLRDVPHLTDSESRARLWSLIGQQHPTDSENIAAPGQLTSLAEQ